jgi:hypothetical protein
MKAECGTRTRQVGMSNRRCEGEKQGQRQDGQGDQARLVVLPSVRTILFADTLFSKQCEDGIQPWLFFLQRMGKGTAAPPLSFTVGVFVEAG